MWTAHTDKLPGGRTLKVTIHLEATPLTYAEVLHQWHADAEFRAFFNALLVKSPFDAVRWETPPVTEATAGRVFEFVLINSPGLARKPDADAFAEHFERAGRAEVIEFPNLGGDAILVVPCPSASPSVYTHLASFVRQAPESQRQALWELVGATMLRRLGTAPVWLSTAGAGVSWLHVRLDNRPKYYGHEPYRSVE